MSDKTLTMPSQREPASTQQPAKQERMIPLKLKRGYWAKPGTAYRAPVMGDEIDSKTGRVIGKKPTGEFSEGVVTDTKDEFARRAQKLQPGYCVTLPVSEAKPLLDGGKAELDAGY